MGIAASGARRWSNRLQFAINSSFGSTNKARLLVLNFKFNTKPGSSSGRDVRKYPTCSNTCSLADINRHMLQVKIIDNDKGGHEDLLVNIEGLINKVFDTYYFAIAIEPFDDLQDIKNAVAKLLMYWRQEIQSAKDGQKVYLPIDFSDQYSGCVEVVQSGENLQLRYGYTERGGWNINPLDPGDYSKTVADFEDTENITSEISKADFIRAIEMQITKLTAVS